MIVMSYEQASTIGTDTNPLVGGKLGVSDCSQVTDGVAGVVFCSDKFIAERGMRTSLSSKVTVTGRLRCC